jgi:hypothetical protein
MSRKSPKRRTVVSPVAVDLEYSAKLGLFDKIMAEKRKALK